MSKTLIVVRHGHAVDGEDDFPRQLSERGVAEVNAAGKALAQAGLVIDEVLTSAAPRAATTASLLAKHCACPKTPTAAEELYLAEPLTILAQVCATSDQVKTLLLVGHNPGLSTFVERMSGQACELRTAQVVHLQLDTDRWRELSFAQ